MIDITKFFIINQQQFNSIITFLNCDLVSTDKQYVITYLFANFLGYFLIIMTLIISMKMYRTLRRKVYNARLI